MTEETKTYEPQYDILFDVRKKHGTTKFGIMANESWNEDPRRTIFTLARYKFVSKMLEGRQKVLEVGCADAFGTRVVQQTVGAVTAVDIDPVFIEDARARMNSHWPLEVFVHDLLETPVPGEFDAAYALDVLEHITPEEEETFLTNMMASVCETGIVIIGMPSLESQAFASPQSKAGHVNCKNGNELKKTMQKWFNTVFVFSMNDEVVHTGFYPMAHYLLAVCCHKKSLSDIG